MKLLGLLLGLGLTLGSEAQERSYEERSRQLPRGTEIRLILLKELNSGGSVVGEEVPFLVAEDVIVRGKLVIREGTVATGRVKQARREGALSAMLYDRPARLAVELEQTWDVDGRMVPLSARLNGKEQRLYHFNRDNTKIPLPEDNETRNALKTPEKRKVLEMLVDTLKGSTSIADVKDNAERNLIMEVARALRLHNTVELLLNNRILDLVSLGAKLSNPGIATYYAARAAFGAAQLTFRAAKEVAHIATHFPGFLSRKFGGRNINAALGLEISALAS